MLEEFEILLKRILKILKMNDEERFYIIFISRYE